MRSSGGAQSLQRVHPTERLHCRVRRFGAFSEAKEVSEVQFLIFFVCSFSRKSGLSEDLYRANFQLGNIYFRNSQKSKAVRCLEQAKECARKLKDKFGESECFHCIGKVSHRFLQRSRC